MAQIIICDLCKRPMSSEQGERSSLTLKFFKDGSERQGDCCGSCTKKIIFALDRQSDLSTGETKQKKNTELLEKKKLAAKVIGKNKHGVPLFENEVVAVPSAIQSPRDIAALNKKIDEERGCPHHYKTYDESRGGAVCADAPKNAVAFRNFKGCGKILRSSEL